MRRTVLLAALALVGCSLDIDSLRAKDGGQPDAGPDAGSPDAGPPDAGTIATPRARFPWNGYATGSVQVSIAAPVVDHPLRPELVWTAVPQADHYELQVTSECAVESFRACAFESPVIDERTTEPSFRPDAALAVDTVAPVGRRYYWRVRSCHDARGCSPWTEVRYLDVGRQVDDLNGDGYGDVVVGAPYQNRGPGELGGNAFVYFGGPSGSPETHDMIIENPLNQTDGGFGFSVVHPGDLNGDGFSDLIVGAYRQDQPELDEGAAYVFFGSPTGPSSTPDVVVDNPLDRVEGTFGGVLAGAGDLNGDGYADFVVGVGSEGVGAAHVYYGGVAVVAEPALTLSNPLEQPGQFGGAVASAGDIDGDGYVDLLVGAPSQDVASTDDGVVYVFRGGSAGPSSPPSATLDAPFLQSSTSFGGVLASAGDLDGDGLADFIVGAPGRSNPEDAEGAAYVYLGNEDLGSLAADVALDPPSNQMGSRFGSSVAGAGDVNGDGHDDLLVGAPRFDGLSPDSGRAYVYFGASDFRTDVESSVPDVTIANPLAVADAQLGNAVACVGDVNGDGYADVAVGAYFQDSPEDDEGSAYIFHGAMEGPAPSPDSSMDDPFDRAYDHFGFSIARACDPASATARAYGGERVAPRSG